MQLGQGCVLPSPCEKPEWVHGLGMMVLEDKPLA